MRRIMHICFLAFWVMLSACGGAKKKTDWSKSYSTGSKEPYGFSLFAKALPLVFKNAKVKELPASNVVYANPYTTEKSAYILVAENARFSIQELSELDDWLSEGNDVMIIATNLNEDLEKMLYLNDQKFWRTKDNLYLTDAQLEDSISNNVLLTMHRAYGAVDTNYKYNIYKQNIFEKGFDINPDSVATDSFIQRSFVISELQKGYPNAVQLQVGTGRLIVCSTPLAFSNYALLQGNDYKYLQDLMSYVHPEVKSVFFSVGYYREPQNSDWGVIWKNKSTRAALLLALAGMLIYVLVNIRRKQQAIPIIKPLNNDSKSFVETIAGLYYANRNNRNLAQKMTQHFLDHVRSNYKLNTNVMDDEFIKKLSLRSGHSLDASSYLISQIRSVQEDSTMIDDKFLFSLYTNIQRFYKK